MSDFDTVAWDDGDHYATITTAYYRAPQVFLKLVWNHKCDIWSMGCVLFELYWGVLLFPTESDADYFGFMEQLLGLMPEKMVAASKTTFFKNGLVERNGSEADQVM